MVCTLNTKYIYLTRLAQRQRRCNGLGKVAEFVNQYFSSIFVFTFEFIIDFTKKVISKEKEFTSSIIDDHLPLIAGGAAILFVLLIAVFVCCFIRRRHRKKDGRLNRLVSCYFTLIVIYRNMKYPTNSISKNSP